MGPDPVVPLELVVAQTAAIESLFRPTLVSDELLREPPRRVAQLQAPARRHLKVKLAAYWGRAAIVPNDLPLHERDEDDLAVEGWPPSPYDPADVRASRST